MKTGYRIFMTLICCLLLKAFVYAGVLSTVNDIAQIQPMKDGSGKYMLKSNGFYCLDENGALSTKPEIHYFDHYEIDGTVFHGYYYHDADGLFLAVEPHLLPIRKIAVMRDEIQIDEETGEESEVQVTEEFDGWYLVGNLGKIGGASRVIYTEDSIENVPLNGYYYIDAKGMLARQNGNHYLHMECNGRKFDGLYYFGGPDGALVTEACLTAEGYETDAFGKIQEPENPGMTDLRNEVNELISQYQGNWSIYVKDMQSNDYFSIREAKVGSASVIKIFVMAGTYANLKQVLENEAARLNLPPADPKVQESVDKLLWNMITISDNEAYNELVRLQTAQYNFSEGAKALNAYLEKEGYRNTQVLHTLHPSGTESEGIGELNTTSARECGILLEKIYRGECVSKEASEAMTELLLNQTVNWKIRAGLPDGVKCGNKSGENTSNQHDVAIVYGEHGDYVLCVLSEDYGNEDLAFDEIRDVSKMVYHYMDLWMNPELQDSK